MRVEVQNTSNRRRYGPTMPRTKAMIEHQSNGSWVVLSSGHRGSAQLNDWYTAHVTLTDAEVLELTRDYLHRNELFGPLSQLDLHVKVNDLERKLKNLEKNNE